MPYGVVISDAIRALREWLRSSDFKPGARLPSERQLVQQLGMKHNAINRAMSRLIAEGVVQREGYRLSYAGERRAAVTTLTCDLVLARRSLLLRSYRKVAKEAGIGLRLHYYESTEEAVAHLHALTLPGTEGVVFDPSHMEAASAWEPAMVRLLTQGIPAISIRQHCSGVHCVLADYTRAVALACAHLEDSGHREMALLTIPPRAPVALEISEAWRALGSMRGGRATAARIGFYEDVRVDARLIASKLVNEWKNVTALVVYAEHAPIVPHLLGELAKRKRQVPRDLSLLCLGDLPHLATSTPPIGAIAFDISLMQETVFRLAQRLARRKQEAGSRAIVTDIRIQPYLVSRGSVARIAPATSANERSRPARAVPVVQAEQGRFESPAELRSTLRAMWKRPYSLTATATAAKFKPVDLRPFVNRPLSFRKGWLGDLPLTHLTAGAHTIHGVPFQVLGGPSRKDHGAVVFRSMTNETGNARVLPSSVTIPIEENADAIYVLHGCGYARFLDRFATYEFYAGNKRLGTVPLVALGKPPLGFDPKKFEQEAQQANIQDWWPDFPHLDFLQARRAPIVEGEGQEVVSRHVYLYTLEWKNPFPGRKVSHLKITVNADQSTTLGVLAISVLRKKMD
ncbi:MAG: hypothetical protein K0R17_3200 [Rariglobus sp.]|jgi:DNA-binding LacI/PurR family transcriptional regulator|nr:hypothetical protein [Rariglobus sp.]